MPPKPTRRGESAVGPEEPARPLYDAMRRASTRRRLHMPGHFGREPRAADFLTWANDLTETEGLDNLAQPSGVLRDLADRLARSYGARRVWLSVQGATLPVMAGSLGWAGSGASVAMDRGAHKSVLAAAILGNWTVRWVSGTVDPDWGLWIPPPLSSWQPALADGFRHCLLVSPTYDGLAGAVGPLTAAGARVFVDAAHGAHFGRHPHLPPHALSLGADMAAHGVHKTEPVLTQSGLLVARQDWPAVDAWWRLLGTSSPSYLLLAGLEAYAVQRDAGDGGWGAFAAEMWALWDWACARGYRIWQAERAQAGDVVDVAKLTIWGDGPRMARALRERGYEPEATGLMHVTLEFGPAQGWDDAARRQAVLAVGAPTVPRVRYAAPPLPTAAMTPASAWCAPRRRLPLARARGEVAATALTPYPPGIPLVMPGERLDGPVVAYLREIRRQGWPVEGLELDEGAEWLWIVDA